MKKLFLPYELAVIAKEKGFDGQYLAVFNLSNELLLMQDADVISVSNLIAKGKLTKAPLYQQMVDWFREKHHIKFNFNTEMGDDQLISFTHLKLEEWDGYAITIQEKDYYTALNKAIEEAFKLI